MQKELTDIELDTYSRQIVLADIGYDGQQRLRGARACIVGMGGLGSPTALKLVGMGIGHLRMIDRDIVSRSDLHRQHLYDADAIGQPKVEIALRKLSRLNPDVRLEALAESVNSNNVHELIREMDIVIDGLDRPETRYLINRVCHQSKIPYIFGAAIEAFGNVTTIVPGRTACLECFMPGLRDEDLPACGIVGVYPPVLGVVSSVQVSEAVRVLGGREPKLSNRLFYVDLREFAFHILDIPASKTCKVCGGEAAGPPEKIYDRYYEETCARDGRRNFILTPAKRIELDMAELQAILKKRGLKIDTCSAFGITFEPACDIKTCILKSGLMIAQTPPRFEEDVKTELFEIYRSILVGEMGFSDDISPDRFINGGD